MSAETWVAICTGALAVATFILGFLTFRLELAWKESSAQQIGVQTWLHFKERFDSKEMKRCRQKLAQQLSHYDKTKHDEITEELLDLFQDVGSVYERGLLDKDLAASVFSFYVNYWWRAAKPYIDHERMLHQDDNTLFEDFEKLTTTWSHLDPKISASELEKFLADEMNLRI